MPLIEKFKINNLHNYYDVELNFKNDKTIYIGENGVGKTTILSMLYYLLDLNYERLSKYIFESLEIEFEGKKSVRITKSDITQINSVVRSRKGRYPKYIVDELINKIEQDENLMNELLKLETPTDFIFNFEVRKIYEKYPLLHNYPKPLIQELMVEVLERINPAEYMELIGYIEELKNKYKILYFPTYRRIEEDLVKLKTEPENVGPGGRTFNSKSSGELIHFGMEDVKQRIDELLNKISKETNERYNNMTSGLLNTFSNGENIKLSGENFDPEEVNIALSRLGDKITKETKSIILSKINKGELHKDKYLDYLVSSILKNYKTLAVIDSRINDFNKRVNKYLFRKKFYYNPQSLRLDIKRTDSKGETIFKNNQYGERVEDIINLSNLSSGEKQLISTFSKIFLEDEKELIILFDEPELSLSVPWQEEFIYDISQANKCRFLLTVTHSPFIYSNLLPYAEEIDDCIKENSQNSDNEFPFFFLNDDNDDELPF